MDTLSTIEARFTQTKAACKLYSSADSATKTAEREVAKLNKDHGTDIECPFIVTYVPSQDKYTVVFNFTHWLSNYGTGTYLGWFADRKFFSF